MGWQVGILRKLSLYNSSLPQTPAAWLCTIICCRSCHIWARSWPAVHQVLETLLRTNSASPGLPASHDMEYCGGRMAVEGCIRQFNESGS